MELKKYIIIILLILASIIYYYIFVRDTFISIIDTKNDIIISTINNYKNQNSIIFDIIIKELESIDSKQLEIVNRSIELIELQKTQTEVIQSIVLDAKEVNTKYKEIYEYIKKLFGVKK